MTSPPSIFTGYTATFSPGTCASPVFGSLAQPCQGQITFPSSITPSPSGPPRWRQTLSIALISPFTLATQIILSPQGNSFASLIAGRSDWEVSLVKGMALWMALEESRPFAPLRMTTVLRDDKQCLEKNDLAKCQVLSRLHRLRHHHLALEIFHHAFFQPHFSGLLGERHGVDLVLQPEQRVEQVLRTRRAANHVHIHRNDAVDALQHCIGIEGPSDRGARSHRDHPFRFRHLVIDTLHHRRHLQRNRARDDHQIGLPRAGTENFRAEASDVKAGGRRRNHLDGTAGQSKRHWPERRLARPVEDVVHRSDHEVLFELVLQPAHGPSCGQDTPSSYAPGRNAGYGFGRELRAAGYEHPEYSGESEWLVARST